jgi:hypothetical protein
MKADIPLLAGIAFAALLASTQAAASYTNTTAGGPLRPGVYGRIEIGKSPPPPLVYPRPVVASPAADGARLKPVYLYVPPGQIRKWARHCGKYGACELPVYFVRVDNSPSKLGKWKSRGEAGDRLAARMATQTMGGPPGLRD